MKTIFVATCLFGLERFLGQEIDALGLKRIDTIDGRVTFEGEMNDVARLNINLRCAERVYIKVGSFVESPGSAEAPHRPVPPEAADLSLGPAGSPHAF